MLWVYCLVICSTVQYSTYFASMIEGKFLHSGLIAVRDSAQINPAPTLTDITQFLLSTVPDIVKSQGKWKYVKSQ